MSRLDGDNEQSAANVPFPTGAKAAGIIWMMFGTIAVLLVTYSFFSDKGLGSGACCGVVIPLLFTIVGCQTFNGQARGLLGNAIGSIIFGFLFSATSIALMTLEPKIEMIGIGALIGSFSMALLVAGFLALFSRAEYDRWRQANGLASAPRPRPLTQEERDYDDDYRP